MYHGGLFELTVHNAAQYLSGFLPGDGPWSVTPLSGGVSNTVILAESGPLRVVLKQALGKLRVKEDWFADRARIHREAAAIRRLAAVLPDGAVPAPVFEDPDNFILAMSAAPAQAKDWKSLLLARQFQERFAARAAEILAAQFLSTWADPACEREFGDQTPFEQLRIDPYYRFTASRHPRLAPQFNALIRESQSRRCCLVHGDYSPKNLLVHGACITVIDFEVIHYGDPSFDVAFLLNHLLLKAVHLSAPAELQRLAAAFWEALRRSMPGLPDWLETAALRHLGCLHLARVDGKSPAEYLSEEGRAMVRGLAESLIVDPPATIQQAFERASHACATRRK